MIFDHPCCAYLDCRVGYNPDRQSAEPVQPPAQSPEPKAKAAVRAPAAPADDDWVVITPGILNPLINSNTDGAKDFSFSERSVLSLTSFYAYCWLFAA